MGIDTDRFVAKGAPRRRIVHRATLAAPPERVFDTLTTAEGIRFWNGIDANVELEIGGRYEWLFDRSVPEGQQGSEGCQILAYVPSSMLAFSWNAPPHLARVRENRTWVVMTFAARGASTDVELTHLGFGEGEEWDACFDYFEAAWRRVLDSLAATFSRG
ncbi:MAG: SRPBCC domain-containing protein [Myxococcales bacterium]|nr:SRPBCC domain-containing protein [Myxococcales bacterium]